MRQNKNLSGLVETLHVCVCVLEMYLYMSVSACDGGGGVCPCVGLYTVCVRMTETCVFI